MSEQNDPRENEIRFVLDIMAECAQEYGYEEEITVSKFSKTNKLKKIRSAHMFSIGVCDCGVAF